MLRLITRADDAGVTRGTNQAIYQTATKGIIRNVGFMVPTPAFEDAVKLFNPLADEVDLGIHATLTSEWDAIRWGPVSPPEQVPTLLEDDATFVHSPAQLNTSANRDEMITEVEAQIQMALDAGLRASYLDTHMVFSWIEGISERLDELGRKYQLVVDSPQRFPGLPKLKDEDEAPPDDRLAALQARIEAATEPGATYKLVSHPSRHDSDSERMHKIDGHPGTVARNREEEAALLCSDEVRTLLEAHDVTLVRYSKA